MKMAQKEIPTFSSWQEEAEFWDTHDAVEVLGEDGWERIPAGTTPVRSVYQTAVGQRAGTVRIPDELLATVGLKKGKRVRMWVENGRLVLEPA
jgi:hypothetical protein